MLSSVIITKNEEKNIERCIKSLKFCDEIIVIDDYSIDKTVSLANKLGAKVFQNRLDDDFSKQRNFGLKVANREWVLFIDADEVVGSELAGEIIKVTSDPTIKNDGYYLRRQDTLWNKKLNFGENGNTKLLRLGKKNNGIWKRKVHEFWEIKGSKALLRNPLSHYPHSDLSEFINSIEQFSSLHAEANFLEKKRSNIFKIVFWPPLKFFNNYFLCGGFLDGVEGFVSAMLMSMHSYLAWSKLWILKKKIK